MALRSDVFRRMREFLEKYDFLSAGEPAAAVPGDAAVYPSEINGVKLGNYIDWMKTCYYITVTSHPAISVPAGFTAEAALPVGLQIVGKLPRRLRRPAARARFRAGDAGCAAPA